MRVKPGQGAAPGTAPRKGGTESGDQRSQEQEADWTVGWTAHRASRASIHTASARGTDNEADDLFPIPPGGDAELVGGDTPRALWSMGLPLRAEGFRASGGHRDSVRLQPSQQYVEDECKDALSELQKFETNLAKESYDFARTLLDTRDMPPVTPLPFRAAPRPDLYYRPEVVPILTKNASTPPVKSTEAFQERAEVHFGLIGDLHEVMETEPYKPPSVQQGEADSDIIGGAARFFGSFKDVGQIQNGARRKILNEVVVHPETKLPFLFFTGSGLGGSSASGVLSRGRHTLAILNEMSLSCATPGVHDFRYGLGWFENMVRGSKFPWVLSNVTYRNSGEPVCGTTKLLTIQANPRVRLAVIGVCDEWIHDIHNPEHHPISYQDPLECVNEQLAYINQHLMCHLVVVLTHTKPEVQKQIAREAKGTIHLIMGRSEAKYRVSEVNNTTIVNGLPDFKGYAIVKVTLKSSPTMPPRVNTHRVDVTRGSAAPDPRILEVLSEWTARLEKKMGNMIGNCGEELDCRAETLGKRSTNLGNLVADLVRRTMGADVALLPAGAFTADRVVGTGMLRGRNVGELFGGLADRLVTMDVPGERLRMALEHSVDRYPAPHGRFFQVSGLHFSFNGAAPSGRKVVRVTVNDVPLMDSQSYRVATLASVAQEGAYGYTILFCPPMVRTQPDGPNLATVFRVHLKSLKYVDRADQIATKFKRVEFSKLYGVTEARAVQVQSGVRPLPTSRLHTKSQQNGRRSTDPTADIRDMLIAHTDQFEVEVSLIKQKQQAEALQKTTAACPTDQPKQRAPAK